MGQRAAAGDHHPVEVLFLDDFGDMADAVLRTGIQVGLGVDNIWKLAGMTADFCHIQESSYIRSAVADEHADACRFTPHFSFIGEGARDGQAEAGRAERPGGSSGRAAGFDHGFWDILGGTEWSYGIDTRAAGFQAG